MILTNFPCSLAFISIKNFFDSISTSWLPNSSASVEGGREGGRREKERREGGREGGRERGEEREGRK